MTVKELYERLCLSFPSSLSCAWDHDGLMVCSDPNRHVKRVLITLDVTPSAIQAALDANADVILSHHPLLFHPLSVLTPNDPTANKVLRLLEANISVLSFHTRADAAVGGVSDLLAEAMGLSNVTATGEDGILRIGMLASFTPASNLATEVKHILSTPTVAYADAGKPIRFLAVCGGEGGDMIDAAKAGGADALLTGRIGYHKMQDAAEAGLSVFEAGHWYTEIAIVDLFATLIANSCNAEVIPYRVPPITIL